MTAAFHTMRRAIARRLLTGRFPVVRQYDRADCGPAALLSVLRHWGGDASLVLLRELTHTDSDGCSMLALVRAADTLGFRARGATGDLDALAKEQLPCIAHVVLADGLHHYVVVYGIGPTWVLLGDPARGLRRVTREEFLALWAERAVILLSPARPLRNDPAQHWIVWVARHFGRERTWLLQSVFLGVVYTGLWLLTSLFVKRLVDQFIPERDIRGVMLTTGVLVAVQAVRAGAGYLRQRFLLGVSARTSVELARGFLQHVYRLPARFFDTHRRGDVMARINDSVQIQAAAARIIGGTVVDALIIVGTLGATLLVAPSIGWLALGTVPLYAILLARVLRPLRGAQNDAARRHADVESAYVDSLTGIDDIRTFDASHAFAAAADERYRAFQHQTLVLGRLQIRASLGAELAGGVLVIAALAIGAVAVVHGSMGLGAMLAAYSLLASALPSVNRLVEANVAIQSASIAAMRLMDLLLLEREPVGAAGPAFSLERAVRLEHARFAWPRGGVLLDDVDLSIERGRITGLCGPSGCGKSTLAKLLQRNYPLSGGRLLIDDVAADAIPLDSYRRSVAVVREATKIFNFSLLENITLGRPTPSREELTHWITGLGFGGFLRRFPAGLDSRLGEEARQLSSGERQIVGLLRGLFANPALLVIDEGVNAVDVEMTRQVHATLRAFAHDHAVLLISHDPSTLAIADTTFVLTTGRIVRADVTTSVRPDDVYSWRTQSAGVGPIGPSLPWRPVT
jgi:ABC-type bacteriocin/lantibiotic exporter with double-glycine peptidase domain